MAERIVRHTVFLGEYGDKPTEAGILLMTEMRNLSPLPTPEEKDPNGGLISNPGYLVFGEDNFAALPGVHAEPGTVSEEAPRGIPAAVPSESAYFRAARLVLITHPLLQGVVLAVFANGDGASDSTTTGMCLGLHQSIGGKRARVGDVTVPFVEDVPTLILLSPEPGEEVVVAVCSGGTVSLEWTSVATATEIRVYAATENVKPESPTATLAGSATTYELGFSWIGTVYWWVEATLANETIISAGSNYVQVSA